MTTIEMLTKLQDSENDNCAAIAVRILTDQTTIEEELKYTGGFMTAVLKGDYEGALKRADSDNLRALTN